MFTRSSSVPRRQILKATGVSLALPLMSSLLPKSARAAADKRGPIQRFVTICTTLGLHGPHLFPTQAGRDFSMTPYLEKLEGHRQDWTVFSGLSHPEQSGKDGHSSSQTWLTAAPHPGMTGFVNTISIDQLIAEQIGLETRFPSIQLSTSGGSQSYSRSGIMLSGQRSPSAMFAKLFVEGSEQEKREQIQRLREGGSILDMVQDDAKRLGRNVAAEDRQTLSEYYESVREAERRLYIAQEWIQKPKPKVDADAPNDIADDKDIIGQMNLLFDLIPLMVQTDSTRLISIVIDGRNDVPPIPGVEMDHHNLSHHGKDERKIEQLKLIELAQMETFGKLLHAMATKQERGARLLDNTTILFGSNLGNANSHDTRNLPIVLAGGRFKHGQHVTHDTENNQPLSNLFVQIAQQMGQEIDSFGSSTSTSVTGFDSILG